MAKFSSNDFSITQETRTDGEVRVVKVQTQAAPVIQDFEMPDLRAKQPRSYAQVKAKYGALAATDPDRRPPNQKSRRFVLNQLVRAPLSVEEEERRVVEERVKERLLQVEAEARAKAEKEGFEAGLKQGHQAAFEQFRQEGEARLAQLDALLEELDGAKESVFRANEKFLVEVIYRVARHVLLRELKEDRGYVVRLVSDLIEKIGARENISIRIHPDEIETATLIREKLMSQLGALRNVSIEASDRALQGGCLIETEWSSIDASIGSQLQNVHDLLASALAVPASANPDSGAEE